MNTELETLKHMLSDRLIAELDPRAPQSAAETTLDHLLYGMSLSDADRGTLRKAVLDDVLGFAAIEPILEDPLVLEIMINGHEHVFVERRGKLEQVASPFRSAAHLMRMIQNITLPLGILPSESQPIIDARLADGTRVHIVIPPISMWGAAVVLRKLPPHRITLEKLYEYGSLTPAMGEFIRACVLARLNIIVSGGTGSGKTTIHNVLSDFIPAEDRIIVVEDVTELQINKPHLVVLETRPPNVEGRGEITAAQLIESAMKMRPDRIMLSEARGGEVWLMLQALNTGYDGSILNIHATSVRDALTRLEVMATQGNPSAPLLSTRHLIANGVHLILNQQKMPDGVRRLVAISEVIGLHGDTVMTQDIFRFEETAVEEGRVIGKFTPTGVQPQCLARIASAGIVLPETNFGV